ncbi:MAG: hypothetical protein ABIP54_02205 [Candidatus Andersenbacteria bacterium]
MPLQGYNYAGLQHERQKNPIERIFSGLLQGYQMGRTPHNLKQQEEEQDLQQSLLRTKEKYAEPQAQADIGSKQAQLLKAMQDAEGGNLTGHARKAYDLQRLMSNPNVDEKTKQLAKSLFEMDQSSQGLRNEHTRSLIEQAPKKNSTAIAKAGLEREEVKQGFLPGSNGEVRLTPAQQRTKLGQIDNHILKSVSDPAQRERMGYAINIDKTLDAINVDDLVRYSGPFGKIAEGSEKAKSLGGKTSEDYKKYQEAKSLVKLFAKQVRQFNKDSITEGARADLEFLTDPTSWATHPDVARAKFEALTKTIRRETDTTREALSNPYELLGQKSELNGAQNEEADPLGLFS